jgi:hypothetical protein
MKMGIGENGKESNNIQYPKMTQKQNKIKKKYILNIMFK